VYHQRDPGLTKKYAGGAGRLRPVPHTDGERRNDCEMSSTSDDEFDDLGFLGGLSTIIQSMGSMLLSSSAKSRFLISSSFKSESTKMMAILLLKCVI